ncbi:MAG: sugar phosphate nucleotidyltransferase [Candidatus Nanohaloarchaea archaeon]|nr:sugar phosphate nucleotidyltransferase [Candidatus Nanohaloarchaea archaeon]
MQAVVLAGGESSRFWPLNRRHKSLTRIGGKSLLAMTLESLSQAGVEEAVVVQGSERKVEEELEKVPGLDVSYEVQEEPLGMGDALKQARGYLEGYFIVTGPYKIRAGDMVKKLENAREEGGAVAGLETSQPELYGILDFEDGKVRGVTEKPAQGEAPSDYRIVSTYLLHEDFFGNLEEVENRTVPEGTSAHTPSASRDGVGHEYSFEEALDEYMEERAVGFAELEDERPSLKYAWDVFDFAREVLDGQERRIADSADVADSAVVEGNVVIEDDVKVYENAVIRGPVYVGRGSTIGNNAVVREYTSLGEDSTVGANMEIRGTVAQQGLSTHSGFIGDSVIGRNVSFGAGVVVANRRVRDGEGGRPGIEVHLNSKEESVETGRDRLGVLAGDDVDVGTQANLMPGTCIGSGSFVGPSALLNSNVGEDKKYYTKVEGREMER